MAVKNDLFESNRRTLLEPSKSGILAEILHFEHNVNVFLTGNELRANQIILKDQSTLGIEDSQRNYIIKVTEAFSSDDTSQLDYKLAESLTIMCLPERAADEEPGEC